MPTLDWIGKDKVINHHMDVPYRVLDPQYEYGLSLIHICLAFQYIHVCRNDKLRLFQIDEGIIKFSELLDVYKRQVCPWLFESLCSIIDHKQDQRSLCRKRTFVCSGTVQPHRPQHLRYSDCGEKCRIAQNTQSEDKGQKMCIRDSSRVLASFLDIK